MESYRLIIRWYFNRISEQFHLNSIGDEILCIIYKCPHKQHDYEREKARRNKLQLNTSTD